MDVVEAIRAVPGAHRDRGTLFEQLTAEYLRRDPVFAARFSEVWLWSDWPGRGTATDTGIDLVAQEADGSGLCAVQCKLYGPDHQVSKADIDTFFSASGKRGFTSRLIVSTTDKWGSNAEAALVDQTIPVSRIGLADMAVSPIEWDARWIGLGTSPTLTAHRPHNARPHQQQAVEDVFAGWAAGADRGQLIMACGTGKTFTSLKVAERLTAELGRPINVLFLVPSIALLSQSLREWTAESTTPMHCQAVCSDPKSTAEARKLEDVSAHDLPLAASTDPQHLLNALAKATAALRVVFSTYQSIDQIAAAVRLGEGVLNRFDLIICDEAHRTTGVTLAGQDESHFVKVHDNEFLPADRRLYMTATPKIFADETKQKAVEHDAVLASMDDPTHFGPVFHRLGFGKAVDQGLLADYRVLILTVDEAFVAKGWQQMLADSGNELTLDDAARIVGCWNGLAKRSPVSVDPTTGENVGFPPDAKPMRRAVAFSHTIKASKALAAKFEDVTAAYTGQHAPDLRCEVEHVDGTMNSLTRNEKLAWLKAPTHPDECRILSNARCLSEGVDVPTLDAVLFLTPRNSVVDVVQSVGRVMRTAPGKEYGYVILPVAVPADMAPEEALRDNQRYKVVWQVLQALRAHDDRFNATINKIDLNTKRPDQIMVLPVTDPSDTETRQTQGTLTFPVELLTDAVYSRIVSKVGQRTYWEQLAKDVAQIAKAHVTRITAVVNDPDSGKRPAFEQFLEGLQATINPGIDEAAAIDMLAQHLVTRPVFEALFADYQFLQSNPVSATMQRMLEALEDQALDKERVVLHDFYESVRLRAEGVDNHAGRQRIMTELYEKFFKNALPKTADALGIVYTPVEVVDFILRTTDQALQRHLGSRLTDEGVQVLDPFTGTGTFISRLLASGLIDPHDLARKYTSELNANEMVLLAYYIAAVNIEAAYHDVAGASDFQPFDGIVLTDTFQMSEDADVIDHQVFSTNTDRALRQLGLDIRVIIGNPPYSVGQTSMNDANQNLKYPTLDRSIEQTYAERSTATNKNALYDSYIRAFRWASNRIGDRGVIAYVSNGGWIDGNVHDGMRKTLVEEFNHIYVFNLRGNARGAGELRAKEAGNVFGGSSRTTVSITLLVKTGDPSPAQIRYCDIGDYLSREQKLALVEEADLDTLSWETITPNPAGDWINQRSTDFEALVPIGDKKGVAVFTTYSSGLKTNRDSWLYNFDRQTLLQNLHRMVSFHNEQVTAYQQVLKRLGSNAPSVESFIDTDPTRISWNRADKSDIARRSRGPNRIRA